MPSAATRAVDRDAWISIKRHEAVNLRFVGHQPGEDAPEAQRVLAERRTHPVLTRRRRVALVENQVNHFEHGGQPDAELVAARDLERDSLLGERLLGSDDPLRHRRLGDEKGARDLLGRQSAEQPQRERDPRLGGQHRMAGGEDQAQQVVADVIVQSGIEIRCRGVLRDFQLVAELLMLALEERAAAQQVDGAVLRRRHEPCAGIAGDTGRGPLFERGNQCVVRKVFCEPDVADDAQPARR